MSKLSILRVTRASWLKDLQLSVTGLGSLFFLKYLVAVSTQPDHVLTSLDV